MKKGFTLIELIFVIVIVGILSATLIPRFNRPTLTEAAHQLVSHIQYTQHLAMVNDVFDSKDNDWYKERWMLQFGCTEGSDLQWAYTIFSDRAGGSTGVADISEIAKNPLTPALKFMTGGYSTGTLPYKDAGVINPKITKEMNLGHKYDISKIPTGVNAGVRFSGGCNNISTKISFDYMGRPLRGAIDNLTTQYMQNATSYLLATPCDIRLLTTDGQSVTIRIEPETGYTYIL